MKVRINMATKQQQRDAVAYGMKWLKDTALPKVTRNVEAIILWQLHEKYGFGKKRLLQFLEDTGPMISGMLDYYDFNTDSDAIWLCEHKLKTKLGIDLAHIEGPFSATVKLK